MNSPKMVTYDPFGDLRERYPTWHVGMADLGMRSSEVVALADKMILVDIRGWAGDMTLAWAHVVSHLDYHMDRMECLLPSHCDEADYYARIRLDRPSGRPEADWDAEWARVEAREDDAVVDAITSPCEPDTS